jgi:hypothetical protein
MRSERTSAALDPEPKVGRKRHICVKRLAVGLVFAIATTSCSSARTGATDWDLVTPPTGTTVVIRVWVGDGCHKLVGVEQHETASSVELVARAHSSGAHACTANMQGPEVTVQLRRPFGMRTLTGCRPSDPITASRHDPGPNCGAG